MNTQVTRAAGDAGRDAPGIIDEKAPADGSGDARLVIVSALDKVRREYAAELRYRRLVAWVACLIVAVLLLGAVVSGYFHRDRVATLESRITAVEAVADERADAIRELRAELAAARQVERDLRSRLATAQQAADAAESRAAALQTQAHDRDATIAAPRTRLDRERQRIESDPRDRDRDP